ncbi:MULTISPECIES: hypothetical protein [unclassified Moraxella]|uniref:hypothetical protein n=1 Tax=unclassified Moraxella TaxID=2685852 RepID=UPI00359E01F2
MNFNINLGKWVIEMIEKYENSALFRRLVYFVLLVVALFPLSPVLVSVIERL